jgi:hypothetical protein
MGSKRSGSGLKLILRLDCSKTNTVRFKDRMIVYSQETEEEGPFSEDGGRDDGRRRRKECD